MRREQGEALDKLVRKSGAVKTIETGFAMGISGLLIHRAGLANATAEGRPEAANHIAMDPFEERRWHSAGRHLFDLAGVGERLHCHEQGSELVLPRLLEAGSQFDFGFVDGDHKFDSAFIDIFYMLRLIRPGGLIAVDDTWMPSVRAAVDFFIKDLGLVVDAEFGDDPEHWKLRRWKRKALRRLRRLAPATNMVVLRVPDKPTGRDWEHFVRFASPRIC
ncbi:MAG: hypothetical protein ACI8QC_003115 [Planctomycetota bacterium]|jgi:hypothetical protein